MNSYTIQGETVGLRAASNESEGARGDVAAARSIASLPSRLRAWSRGEPPMIDDAQADAIEAIARALFARDKVADATDLFRLLVLCRPQEARGWLHLGGCYESIGATERALATYEAGAIAPLGGDLRAQIVARIAALHARNPCRQSA